MKTSTTNGQGQRALGKPVPFYIKPDYNSLLTSERIACESDILKKNLANAREMLATIEQDGDFSSHLHGFYVSRVNKLQAKLSRHE